jgi:hypothetical protein
MAVAKQIAEEGRFAGFAGLVTHGDLGKLFAEDMQRPRA